MKITHVCLAGSYNDYWTYHDNLLSEQNKKDGHDVTIITTIYTNNINTEVYNKVNPGEYIDKNGIKVIRINNCRYLPESVNMKFRKYNGLYKTFSSIKPDVIYVHCPQFFDLNQVGRYLKKHKNVLGFIDNHADFYNSAKTFISREILHKRLYKYVLNKNIKYFEKLFYIAKEGKVFLYELYGMDKYANKVEYFPLGGAILDNNDYEMRRTAFRRNFEKNCVLYLHTGKMSQNKGTLDLLETFSSIQSNEIKLLLAGELDTDIKKGCMDIIEKDDRIIHMGWLDANSLINAMCGCDILLQPLSRSASYQNAICNRMAAILENNENNEFLLSNKNGLLLSNKISLKFAIEYFMNNEKLYNAKQNALEFARNELDYRILAQRIYKERDTK